MFSNHLNQPQSNIEKSYILKSKTGLEKYIAKARDGTYYLSILTEAETFENKNEAESVANMLKNNNQQVEVLEIQDRTRW